MSSEDKEEAQDTSLVQDSSTTKALLADLKSDLNSRFDLLVSSGRQNFEQLQALTDKISTLIDVMAGRFTVQVPSASEIPAEEVSRVYKDDSASVSIKSDDEPKFTSDEDLTTFKEKLEAAGISTETTDFIPRKERRAISRAEKEGRGSEFFKDAEMIEDRLEKERLDAKGSSNNMIMPLSVSEEASLCLQKMTFYEYFKWAAVLREMSIAKTERKFPKIRYLKSSHTDILLAKAAISDHPAAAKILERLGGEKIHGATDIEIDQLFYFAFAPKSRSEWISKLRSTVFFKEMRAGYKYSYFTLEEFITHLMIFLRNLVTFHNFCTMYCTTRKLLEEYSWCMPNMSKKDELGYIKNLYEMVPNKFLKHLESVGKVDDNEKFKDLHEYVAVVRDKCLFILKSLGASIQCRNALSLNIDPRSIEADNRKRSTSQSFHKLRVITDSDPSFEDSEPSEANDIIANITSTPNGRKYHNFCRYELDGGTCKAQSCPRIHFDGNNGKLRSEAAEMDFYNAYVCPHLNERYRRNPALILNTASNLGSSVSPPMLKPPRPNDPIRSTSHPNRVTIAARSPTVTQNYQSKYQKPLASFNPSQRAVSFLEEVDDISPAENDFSDEETEHIYADSVDPPVPSRRRMAEDLEEYAEDPLFAAILPTTTATIASASKSSDPLSRSREIHRNAYRHMNLDPPTDVLVLSPAVLALTPDKDRVPPMVVQVIFATESSITTTSCLLDTGANSTSYISKTLLAMLSRLGRVFPYKSKATLANGTAKIDIEEYVVVAVSITNPITGQVYDFFQVFCIAELACPAIFGLPSLIKDLWQLVIDLITFKHNSINTPEEAELLNLFAEHDAPLICALAKKNASTSDSAGSFMDDDHYDADEPFNGGRQHLRDIGAISESDSDSAFADDEILIDPDMPDLVDPDTGLASDDPPVTAASLATHRLMLATRGNHTESMYYRRVNVLPALELGWVYFQSSNRP